MTPCKFRASYLSDVKHFAVLSKMIRYHLRVGTVPAKCNNVGHGSGRAAALTPRRLHAQVHLAVGELRL